MKMTITEMIVTLEAQGYTLTYDLPLTTSPLDILGITAFEEMIVTLEAQGYTIMDDDRIHNVFPFARARARVRGIPVTPVTMVLFAPDGVHIPMYAYNGSWSTFYTSDWSRSFMFVTNEEAQAFVSSFLEWYASQDTE